MDVRYAQLQKILGTESLTGEALDAFVSQLQKAALLALQERGRLSIPEYRFAAEKLLRPHRSAGKGPGEAG